MNNIYKFTLLAGLVIFNQSRGFSQITVVPGGNPATLVQNILAGGGINISNVTFTGNGSTQIGTFSGASNLGISSGLVLSSGGVINIPNDAFLVNSADDYGSPGDPDLELLSGSLSTDAAILEFDFTPESDTITFRYVFGSEEYSDYVEQGYNDAFGIFISGPGISGPFSNNAVNLALLPGTATPVMVDSVNNGYMAAGNGPPTGPCMNCAFYNDNTNGTTIVYDGLTTVLTVSFILSSCNTYHIKFVVADEGADGANDAGVFLDANSFSSTPSVTASGPISFCFGDSVILTATSNATGYLWSNGDSTQSITVTSSGSYYVTISTLAGCTSVSGPIMVTASSQNGTITPSGPTTFCYGGSVILSANLGISYSWSDGSTTQNINIGQAGTYTVTVTDTIGCINDDSISIEVNPLPVVTFQAFNVDTMCINSGQQTISSGIPTGGILSGAGVTGNTFDPNIAGIGWHQIMYEFTDSLGCSNTATDSVFIDGCPGINSHQISKIVEIFPNPAYHLIHFNFSDNSITYDVILYDMPGRVMKNAKLNQTDNSMDISDLQSGNYILKIQIKQSIVSIQRVVKLN